MAGEINHAISRLNHDKVVIWANEHNISPNEAMNIIINNFFDYNNQISEFNSTDFLTLVQDECARRKVDRNKVKGGNDIEINNIYI